MRDSGLGVAFLSMVVSASLQALERNKLRSALTMLGVFIGVAALIAMVAVGDGASAAVKKQLESLGTNMVVVQPGATTAGGVRAGAGSASTLTVTDAQTILRDDPAVAQVGYLTRQTAQVEYGDQNWSTAIQGVSPSYPDIVSWRIADGAAMTEQENDAADTVCLIGQTVYQNLFPPGEDPGRRDGPDQGRADAGDRAARRQGPDRLRPGPGRCGADPVQHRRAQGAGRRHAAGGPEPGQRHLSAGAQRLRPQPDA